MKQASVARALACAALAALLAFAWQFLDVRYNYRGNWTGLFCVGDRQTLPPALADRDIYRFAGSPGYDGQFYYFIATDLTARGETRAHVDNPPMRWRRILVPALAAGLAGGRVEWIPAAYIALVLLCLFAGTAWLSLFVQRAGCSAWLGLGFLLVPAVAVSLDRMTVDIALAALAAAFAWYGAGPAPGARWKMYAVLAAAPLVRETGLALLAGYALYHLLQRRAREAAIAACLALPMIGWFIFVHQRLWTDATRWVTAIPFAPLVWRTFHPVQFAIRGKWFAMAAALDYVAVIGAWTAICFTLWLVWKRRLGLLETACVVFAAGLAIVAEPLVWADAYAFGRTISPLLLWLALVGIGARSYRLLAPLLLTSARIAFQVATISLPILKGLIGQR